VSSEAKEKGAHGAKGGHRKHEEHEEHEEHVNHEAWVIPYADLLTLLLAMFLCLWATSKVDEQKFAAVANALASEFGGEIPFPGGDGVLDGGATSTQGSPVDFGLDAGRALKAEQALDAQELQEQLVKNEQQQFKTIAAQLQEELAKAGLGDNVSFRQEERGLVVTIVTDQVLFVSGEADVQIRGKQILDGIVNALTKIDNNIQIEGHTDSRPISNGRYPSNWELSTSRATNVLRYFVDVEGFPANRISASGYGDTKPLASNDTAEGQSKNRRVELVVLSGVK
jgi:chemotaxis protein MotB